MGARTPQHHGPRAPCPVRFAERGRQVLPSGRECPAGCQPTMLKRRRLGPRRRMAGEVLPRRRDACGHCQRDRGAAGQPGRRRPRAQGDGPAKCERRSDRWSDSGLCPALGRGADAGGTDGALTVQSGAKPPGARSMREWQAVAAGRPCTRAPPAPIRRAPSGVQRGSSRAARKRTAGSRHWPWNCEWRLTRRQNSAGGGDRKWRGHGHRAAAIRGVAGGEGTGRGTRRRATRPSGQRSGSRRKAFGP